jgi:hypothetical protein
LATLQHFDINVERLGHEDLEESQAPEYPDLEPGNDNNSGEAAYFREEVDLKTSPSSGLVILQP